MACKMMWKTYSWLSPKNQSRSLRQSIKRSVAIIGFSNNVRNDNYNCQEQGRRPYTAIVAKPFAWELHNVSLANNPTPMQIDTTHHHGPLSEEEKQRRRSNRFCLYCGGPGYIVVNCSHWPRRQVNQIVASTKPESISLEVSDSPNSPSLSNKFEVLNQLDEELND